MTAGWAAGPINNNSGILTMLSAILTGNKQGMEQVYYVEYRKQETLRQAVL